MREERVILEYIADAAAARRHIDAELAIEPRRAVDDDAAIVGRHETREHLQRQRLAGARGSVQRKPIGVGGKRNREIETAVAGAHMFFDVDVDAHDYSAAARM